MAKGSGTDKSGTDKIFGVEGIHNPNLFFNGTFYVSLFCPISKVNLSEKKWSRLKNEPQLLASAMTTTYTTLSVIGMSKIPIR